MYYYTYKIECTEGSFKGKKYFGKHKTNNLNDNYICSSKILHSGYLKKHPNGYVKTILEFYNSIEELNAAEKKLISKHRGKDYCLNIAAGGDGGDVGRWKNTTPEQRKEMCSYFKEVQKNRWANLSEEERSELSKKMSKSGKGRTPWNKNKTGCFTHTEEWKQEQSKRQKGKKRSDESIQHMSDAWKKMTPEARELRIKRIIESNTGRKKTDIARKHMSEARLGIVSPNKGKIGVHKDNIRTYIFKEDLDYYIKLGYTLGFK